MKYYELMAIVHPNIEEVGLTKITEEIKVLVAKRGGEIVYVEDMGKRKLAYPVEKQRFGTYLLIQFTGDGAGNARLQLDLEHKDNVMAHMVVKIREQDVREEREDEEVDSAAEPTTKKAASPTESTPESEIAPVVGEAEQDDSSADVEAETSTDEVADEVETEASDPEVEPEASEEPEAPEESEAAEESEVAEEK